MLFRLLAAPVAGPLGGIAWVARQIAQMVEDQNFNPKRIEAALLALERRLEAGEIDEAAFETAEAELLEELRLIRARQQAKAGAA